MRVAEGLLGKDRRGAVAPTLALALFALIGMGGIAFDYSRMASMDTELQNAADQAALAAATQLDGETGSRARAIFAARNLVANLTYFANDGGNDAITVPTIIFYSDYDPVTGAKGPEASGDTDANYVLVTVGARTANYALTPVVAALSSGSMAASAFATLDSAYCNLPPFLLCKPGPTFNVDDNIGKGLRLVIGSTVAPGNFGFIQTGFGTGAENLAKALGWEGAAGGCVRARGGIPTEPGNKQSVRAAFNTRFDLSEAGQTCPAGGSCPPSTNSRKDLVHDQNGGNCGTGGQKGWREPEIPYRARNTSPLSASNPMIDNTAPTPDIIYPETMGHPRDLCHAVSQAGVCPGNGIVGTGVWDRDAYFHINYGWDNATWKTRTGLTDDPTAANYATRYKVYLWEAANPLPDGAGQPGIGTNQPVKVVGGGGNLEDRWASSWTGSTPSPQRTCRAPGVQPDPADPLTDRRATSVAVVDCTGLNGRDVVPPLEWMDVFLVEPTFSRGTGASARTDNGDIYVEVIGSRELPGVNQNLGQVIRRDVPRLIE